MDSKRAEFTEEKLNSVSTDVNLNIIDLTYLIQGLTLYRDEVMRRTKEFVDSMPFTQENADKLAVAAYTADKVMNGLGGLYKKLTASKNKVRKEAEAAIGMTFDELAESDNDEQLVNTGMKLMNVLDGDTNKPAPTKTINIPRASDN